jgi:biotin transport system substrate-specific component
MVTAALLAALLAASAWVTIPTQPVPLTFQTLVVVLAALLLDWEWSLAAVGLYVLMGAVGLPVFSGARGGLGVLLGPTGGYLVGFVLAAAMGAASRTLLARRLPAVAADALAAAAVVAIVYVIGWPWLARVTGMPPQAAFLAGVAPFLPLDAAKAAAAVGVAAALRRAGVPALAVR